MKTKIETNAEQIKFSKFLATIKRDVPIAFEAEKCLRDEPDKEKLIEIYERLEFRKFREDLAKENVKEN